MRYLSALFIVALLLAGCATTSSPVQITNVTIVKTDDGWRVEVLAYDKQLDDSTVAELTLFHNDTVILKGTGSFEPYQSGSIDVTVGQITTSTPTYSTKVVAQIQQVIVDLSSPPAGMYRLRICELQQNGEPRCVERERKYP